VVEKVAINERSGQPALGEAHGVCSNSK
jgi:hypothetical protein